MQRITFLTVAFLIYALPILAQDEPKTLKVNINNNAIIDIFRPTNNSLEMNIDNMKYSIPYEELGFERLYPI